MEHVSKLKPEVKEKWLSELESGKWDQLRDGWGGDKDGAYCCLQVLRMKVLGLGDYSEDYADPEDDIHKEKKFEEELLAEGLCQDDQTELVHLNDDEGANFKEIASWIRENVGKAAALA